MIRTSFEGVPSEDKHPTGPLVGVKQNPDGTTDSSQAIKLISVNGAEYNPEELETQRLEGHLAESYKQLSIYEKSLTEDLIETQKNALLACLEERRADIESQKQVIAERRAQKNL